MDYFILNGDCLEKLKHIKDGSVDMVLTDLPYGVLNKGNKDAKWDNEIPLDKLWPELERVTKDNGAIVLFGSGMFTAKLMMSNPKHWRYNLIWNKKRVSGFLNSKRMPLRQHEDIVVFYKKLPTYNPQMEYKPESRNHSKGYQTGKHTNRCYGNFGTTGDFISDYKYPRSILTFDKPHPAIHPTEKSVPLLEYLIKTYTNEGEVVLDCTMGSGSTGVAAMNTGRSFIGIEADTKWYNVAQERIEKAINK